MKPVFPRISIVLAFLLVICLGACSFGRDKDNTGSEEQTETAETGSATEKATEAETDSEPVTESEKTSAETDKSTGTEEKSTETVSSEEDSFEPETESSSEETSESSTILPTKTSKSIRVGIAFTEDVSIDEGISQIEEALGHELDVVWRIKSANAVSANVTEEELSVIRALDCVRSAEPENQVDPKPSGDSADRVSDEAY